MANDVKYINKQFDGLKSDLVEYAKNYFPKTYNDFNSSSPAMMFIEMASYVGDVLSYYTDYALKENMIQHSQERKNLYQIAQSFGYKPKISVASAVELQVYMKVPASNSGSSNSSPNNIYAGVVEPGLIVKSTRGQYFKTLEPIDFSVDTVHSPRIATASDVDDNGDPTYYLLKKSVRAQGGEARQLSVSIASAEKYKKILVDDENIVGIDKVVDSDNNIWYEVPYLAQDTMFEENLNTEEFDPTTHNDKTESPYILSLRKTSRRFITRITAQNKLELQFGSGISSDPDVEIIPNPTNVGTNLPGSVNNLDIAFDPSNFLNTNTYGQAPSNTTLTIYYSVGYGLAGNVDSEELTTISSGKDITYKDENATNATIKTQVEASIVVNNEEPASGGRSIESMEEIRNNALAYFGTQNRAVTREDYIVRSMAMPARYGSISKICIEKDSVLVKSTKGTKQNPLALNLYVLGYDRNRSLTNLNDTTKKNLKNYLSQYRILTDAINIKNGYVINIGIDFGVVVLPGKNSKETILRCIKTLKNNFHVDKMQFSQPIIIKDIILALASVEGVQSVISVDIRNNWKSSLGYSGNKYDLESANSNGVIYPSLDPAVFEIKFPDQDIRGKAETY